MQKTLDLNKVKEIIFEDIEKLLDSFDLEYEQVADNIFMKCPIHEGSGQSTRSIYFSQLKRLGDAGLVDVTNTIIQIYLGL